MPKPKNYKRSSLETRFQAAWARYHPDVQLCLEHQFHPTRKWRLDYAATNGSMVAIELQGGIFTNGGHSRASGQIKDMEKYNAAAALGWRIFYLHTKNVSDRAALAQIAETIQSHTTEKP